MGLCSATERGEVSAFLPENIYTRERHTSAPLVDEYRLSAFLQPVGVESAPRALFALGVVQPASYSVRWGTRLVTAAVVVCRVCDAPQVE